MSNEIRVGFEFLYYLGLGLISKTGVTFQANEEQNKPFVIYLLLSLFGRTHFSALHANFMYLLRMLTSCAFVMINWSRFYFVYLFKTLN